MSDTIASTPAITRDKIKASSLVLFSSIDNIIVWSRLFKFTPAIHKTMNRTVVVIPKPPIGHITSTS